MPHRKFASFTVKQIILMATNPRQNIHLFILIYVNIFISKLKYLFMQFSFTYILHEITYLYIFDHENKSDNFNCRHYFNFQVYV